MSDLKRNFVICGRRVSIEVRPEFDRKGQPIFLTEWQDGRPPSHWQPEDILEFDRLRRRVIGELREQMRCST